MAEPRPSKGHGGNGTETAVKDPQRLLRVMNRIVPIFLNVPDDEMYNEVLKILLETTDSRHGFFAFIDENGSMVAPSMTKDIWDQCQIPGKTYIFPRESWGGTWGRALTEKRAVLSNGKHNTPEGHIQIGRSLCVPLIHIGEVVGLFGVANRQYDYTADDVEQVKAMADFVAPVLHARLTRDRSKRERKQVADALRESEERYHKLVEGMTEGMAYCRMLYDDHGRPADWIYLNVNSNFETLTGLHDMVGKRVTEKIPGIEKSDPELFEIYGRVASSGKPEVFESEIKSLRQWLKISVFCPEKDHFVAVFEDITKRKQTEDALKKSEMKYRQLVDLAQEGIWAIDADANTTYTNPRMAEMLGYTLEEMMGRHLFSFMDERGKEIAQIGLDRRAKGIKEQHDFEFLRKDGKRIYASLETSPIMDEAGNYTGALAVVADITERKQAEEALQLKNLVFQASIAANSIADLSGNITEANDAFLRVWGYPSKDEVIGKPLPHFFNEPNEAVAIVAALNDSGEWEGDFTAKRKDGSTFIAHGFATTVKNANGNVIGYQSAVIDITERKRIEDALRESEKRYRLVVDSAAEAIIVAQDGMLRLVNPMTVAITGLSEQELMSKPFPAFIHPDDRAMVVDTYQRRLRGEAVPARYAFRLLAKDGIIKWMEIIAVAIDWEGRPATLNFLTDITERRRAGEALMLANKKLDLMSTLTRHDALNQLSVALGYAEIARSLAEGSNVAPYIDKIMSAGEAVRGPLEFAKTYQSIGANQPEWQNIRRIFDKALSSLDLGNITVENRLADVEVYSDMMLERIFYNLAENTLRHGTNASTIIASQSESSNGLIIVIEDDGGGVPDNEKEVIFNRGYGKHTGDGLYITREILDLTGIAIKEKGILGKGARFEILVPPGAYRRPT